MAIGLLVEDVASEGAKSLSNNSAEVMHLQINRLTKKNAESIKTPLGSWIPDAGRVGTTSLDLAFLAAFSGRLAGEV
jgi:hypothetical protein